MGRKKLTSKEIRQIETLEKFVNLPLPRSPLQPGLKSLCTPNDGKSNEHTAGAVDDFVKKFGELAPGFPKSRYHKVVAGFRFHWGWAMESKGPIRNRKMPVQIALQYVENQKKRNNTLSKIEGWCADILNRNWKWDEDAVRDGAKPLPRPSFGVDFPNGRIIVAHETRLDSLVLSLMRYRNSLRVCQHRDCETPFFVSESTNQKYCTPECNAEERIRLTDEKSRDAQPKSQAATPRRGALARGAPVNR